MTSTATSRSAEIAAVAKARKEAMAVASVKPVPLPVNPTNIPPELLSKPRQWVGWRYTRVDGKWTKPLIVPQEGRNARSTDPADWRDFKDAFKYYRAGSVDGVGFVTNGTGGIVAIDLDECRHPDTGELTDEAVGIIKEMNSYTEISPSGTGLRIFVRGVMPEPGRKKGGVEFFQEKKYLTVTGHRLPGYPSSLESRQQQLDAFYARYFAKKPQPEITKGPDLFHNRMTDSDIIAKAREAKHGDKFKRLWAGDTSDHGGDDSAADLALVSMLAFFVGPDHERIDSLFRQSGLCRDKWTERLDYRERTISKALEGRTEFYKPSTNGVHKAKPATKADGDADDHGDGEGDGLANYYLVEVEEKDNKLKVGLSASAIAKRLLEQTGGWPKRVGSLLFVDDDRSPLYLESPSQLFGWIATALPKQTDNQIRWRQGDDKLTQAHFDAYLRQTVEKFACVNPFPHEPPMVGHYYLHPSIKGGDGRALSALLARFNPATDADRDLVLAYFLTLMWGGEPGQRPAFLITAKDGDESAGRGVGKSMFVKMGGRLSGGAIETAQSESMQDLKTRILSSQDGRGKRQLLIDNVKSLKLSWAELEGFITSDVISGKQHYVGEGRLPNIFVVCITVNGATLSKDMAQRCVIVQLARPTYTASWEQDTIELIENRRWEIIGDIIAKLKAPGKKLARYCRWGAWEAGVLSRVTDPELCQAVIEERQDEVDDDGNERELVREAFNEAIAKAGYLPSTSVVMIPSAVAAKILEKATDEKRPTNRASGFLKTLGIPELRKSDRGELRGWVWRGAQTDQSSALIKWPVGFDP